jgi:BirA family biotin operon repressor/biotin-[acetyl-CoA-carboxylase] ligase
MVNNWLFEHIPTSASTNSDLMERWRNHLLTQPVSLLADEQTAGRGRRGKNWVSAKGDSLTFSMAYPFDASMGMSHLSGLSLFCGLTLMKGIAQFLKFSMEDLHQEGLGLKWPNDLLIGQAKLSGLLVEGGQNNPDSPIWMIIGIGINLHQPKEQIDSDYPSTSLSHLTRDPIDTIHLWKSLTETFSHELAIFDRRGFSPYQASWNQFNVFKNKLVSVSLDQKPLLSGFCQGVNSSGAIEIMTTKGLETLHTGDISLRLQND